MMLPTLCKFHGASPRAEVFGILEEKGTSELACAQTDLKRDSSKRIRDREKPNTVRFRSGRAESTWISQG